MRPFEKLDLIPTKSTPKPELPPGVKVPARVAAIALRAIAVDPDERYASMDALLADLAIDPPARRRRLAVVAVGAAAVVALAGGYVLHARADAKPPPARGSSTASPGSGTRAQGDGPRRVPRDEEVVRRQGLRWLEPALDHYAGGWTKADTESCLATRVRGEQTEDVLSLRQACLDSELDEVRGGRPARPGRAGMVEKGDKSVFGLEPLAKCANVAALRAPEKPAPELRDRVLVLTKKIAEARAELAAGKYLPTLIAAQAAVDGAKQIGYEPLIAEARVLHGAALLAGGNFDQAGQDFAEATYAAIRGKRDDLAADAGLSMAMIASDAGGKPGEAKIWLDHAEAAATRLGVDRAIELRRLEVAGLIAAESGDFNTAIAMHEKMLTVAEAESGKDSPELFAHEVELGTTYSRAGAYAKAAPHYERARALRERSVGPDHPDIALVLSNLGAAYDHMGERARARAAFQRSLAIREKYYGKNSPLIVATLDNFAELLRKEGDVKTALAYQERALALCKLLPGTGHPMYHQLATDYGDTLIAAKRFADARAQFETVFALEEAASSPISAGHEDLARRARPRGGEVGRGRDVRPAGDRWLRGGRRQGQPAPVAAADGAGAGMDWQARAGARPAGARAGPRHRDEGSDRSRRHRAYTRTARAPAAVMCDHGW